MPPAPRPSTRNKTIKKQTPLELRQAERALKEARLRAALDRAKKSAKASDTGQEKRKTNAYLSRYLELSLVSTHRIRDEEAYTAKSYNLSKQVLGLIDHLYVRYPVPLFLYRTMLNRPGIELVFGEWRIPRGESPAAEYRLRPWFLAVARGDSFAKQTRDTFTKKEAHWFLQAPSTNRVPENILWAKAAAAGVPQTGADYLVQRLGPEDLKRLGDRTPDLLRLYAEIWGEMSPWDRDAVTDYLRAAVQDARFSLKGRTLGSLRKLSREWHRTSFAGTLGKYVSWPSTVAAWDYTYKRAGVRAFELTSNRALADEGAFQRHCVFGYTNHCVERRSRIVSMRFYAVASNEEEPQLETTRLTIEIWPASREIVQIRGRLNRLPTDEEMKTIQVWAGEAGYKLTSYLY